MELHGSWSTRGSVVRVLQGTRQQRTAALSAQHRPVQRKRGGRAFASTMEAPSNTPSADPANQLEALKSMSKVVADTGALSDACGATAHGR